MKILTLSLLIAASVSAQAATISLGAVIDSTVSGTGSPGTGTASATIDDVTGAMTITGSFSGLNGLTTNAHLHGLTASAGTGSAGVLFGLTFDSGVTAGSFSGSGTIALGNIAGVIEGRSYINIHTSTNGGGEIRGYLTEVPEPGALTLASLSLCGLLLRRRR